MNKQISYFYHYFLLFAALFFLQNYSWAQSITKSYHVPSFEILHFEHDDIQIKLLTFENAITLREYSSLPVFGDKTEVNQFYDSYRYTLSNAKYQPLTPEEAVLVPDEYAFAEPKVRLFTATDAGKFYAMLHLLPIIKGANGQYQRLVSCDIQFEGADPVALVRKSGLKHSVLASGAWYKIAVSNTGLHKVTYSDLEALGISVSNLRSSSIALFGNGGGMIPEINPVEQIGDLLECPIMVVDNNGVFDENSYFVFYAQGPHTWTPNFNGTRFAHKYNIYSDNAYYFINIDPGIGEKKRIKIENFLGATHNGTPTSFMHYDFYEKDVTNFGESGKEWFGEPFYVSATKTYSFTLPELYDNTARVYIRAATTSTEHTNPRFELSWGANTRTMGLAIAPKGYYARDTSYEQDLPLSSGSVSLSLTYSSSLSSSAAYLDYIAIQAKCKLRIINNAMLFTITENIGASNISLINLENASAQTKIWDVTDHNAVYALERTLSGTQLSFKTPTDKIRRFVAFNGATYHSVMPIGKVTNQNLHGFRHVDMVIVAHPNFVSEAERLAKFRTEHDKLTVRVVTPGQVYNEFSSGAQDPAAIRNFMRYLYDNDARTIKYLLLFGRPSYDYRGRVSGTQLFVPNHQSGGSFMETDLRACDDFFGVLGINGSNLVNVAVGRFPVTTSAQAKIAVDKTLNASARYRIATQNASQVSNFGDWRNVMTFVADYKDGGSHVKNADDIAKVVAVQDPTYNFEKIYSDAYPMVSYAGGHRFPGANNAINMRMERGTLAIAYFGHGGGNGWSPARILEISDINNWKNKYNQPLMITLTCSFGWYDKLAVSPAELAFLNENGGASSVITTSRISYSNRKYGVILFEEMITKENNKPKAIGEIQRIAKNDLGFNDGNVNMIYLIGDPAMRIGIPNYDVQTDEILGEDLQKIDTLKALDKVTVKGRITDDVGRTLTNFNGNIYPSIFDKSVKQRTLGQFPNDPMIEFDVQKSIIFKGNATVRNGQFEFSFYIPKDINFEYGKGKISYYAASENEDAGSYYNNFIIGGMSNRPIPNKGGPEISIFLNDDKFVPGGITNPNPVLLLKLKDEYGINTTGNGIGHDLVAILDNNVEKQMILNDYYLADQDSYNSGTVRYPLRDLTPGTHTLKVRAWDIFNNPSEASIDFVVKSDDKLELAHVLNYPNPFTTRTSFFFEHNHPMETFDILVHIFTISGKLVKTIQNTQFLEGNRSYPIDWDGRDDFGDKIGKGVYIYRLTVRNSQGETAEKIEKIAIL
ncbi:MAG: type IX secretion system sortase PorU [Bacteroidetes bacterium]|nr:type IX secretion system sortase PorU [Bacteroidota bacterium]MCL2301900.1 type IX secretion system sortase PorU [Lentimicrobiaceae bacterium]